MTIVDGVVSISFIPLDKNEQRTAIDKFYIRVLSKVVSIKYFLKMNKMKF